MIDRVDLLRVVGGRRWRVVHDRPGIIATGDDQYDTGTEAGRDALCTRLRAMAHSVALLEDNHDDR